MKFITLKNSSKTDKTAINPAQLDTAYVRSFTLIEVLKGVCPSFYAFTIKY